MIHPARPDDVRRRLALRLYPAPPDEPPARSDFDLNPDMRPSPAPSLVDAAVLVPLIDRVADIGVLFTRRADGLPDHAGQVSFPGGRVQARDLDPLAAALRETEEEVGIGAAQVRVVGFLDRYETRTGFSILPVIGYVDAGFRLDVDTREVAEVFEVPLSFLMDPAHHERHSAIYQGKRRYYYAMPYGGHYIWGATAGMLKSLYDTLYGS